MVQPKKISSLSSPFEKQQQQQQRFTKPSSSLLFPKKFKLSHLLLIGFGVFLIGYSFMVLNFLKFTNTNERNLQMEDFLNQKKNNQQQRKQQQQQSDNGNDNGNGGVIMTTTIQQQHQQQRRKTTFPEWKEYAMELASKLPHEILTILKTQDPFGVRKFEEQLLQAESNKQAFLTLEELQALFPCPTDNNNDENSYSERITLPDYRDHVKAAMFKNGTRNYFLFFQHLRKAGGTNFCTLAKHNLPKEQVHHYYCMPDMDWSGKRCAGCYTRFTNEQIITNMNTAGHRILGNEWDPFDPSRFFDLPAVFTTSFRKPLDRALSQFRFECVEDRGCKIKNITAWWNKRTDLTNVYTWTFSKHPLRHITIGTTEHDAVERKNVMGKAMDTISKFNLVMAMEWLAYSPQHVTDVLGFHDTSTMTERVRPHIGQYARNDGQEHNELGAAGIAKASWKPEEYLSPEQYKRMSEDLALDEILTDAARRIFLERVVCSDMKEPI